MAATHLAGTETDLYREAEERVVIKKEERALSTATDKSNKESHCNSGNRNNNSNTVLGAVHLRLYPLGSVQLQSLQFRWSRGDRILLPLAAAVTTHAKKKNTQIDRTNEHPIFCSECCDHNNYSEPRFWYQCSGTRKDFSTLV